MDFSLDADALLRRLERHRGQLIEGAISGLHDATDRLLADSREIAPLEKGTLRITAGKEVTVEGGQAYGEVYYSVTEEGETGRFNYALRVHEMGKYKNPTTPGTQPKFLSGPLKANSKLYKQLINDAVRRELN